MVRFSLSEGQGEKRRKVLVLPASFSSTSPSAPCLIFASEGEDDDEDDYHYPELDAEQPKEVQAGAGDDGGRAGPSSEGGSKVGCCGGKEAVTVTIDPDALDCPICCETLSPPIFQCKNGHIACSSCCTKMKKCHSCLCPIGPSRCLALENVIESIKVPCPFARNGCRERVGYTQRNLHKQACLYSPCCCPISECAFAGSLKQLSHHFRIRHGDRAIFFMYNVPFMISTGRSEPFQVLLAEDGVLFLLLNNSGAPVGNAVTITLIGPDTLKGAFSYRLIARSTESSIQIESCVTNTKRWDGVFPSKDFLLIPQDFCGMQGVLCLDICVRNKRK